MLNKNSCSSPLSMCEAFVINDIVMINACWPQNPRMYTAWCHYSSSLTKGYIRTRIRTHTCKHEKKSSWFNCRHMVATNHTVLYQELNQALILVFIIQCSSPSIRIYHEIHHIPLSIWEPVVCARQQFVFSTCKSSDKLVNYFWKLWLLWVIRALIQLYIIVWS